LRAVRKLTDVVSASLDAEFDALYKDSGRPSIAPEYILRALLLPVFYSVRPERLLAEQIDYNLLFRRFPSQQRRPVAAGPEFVGLSMGDAMWLHAVFSKSRDWLLTSDVAQQFFAEVKLRGPEKLDWQFVFSCAAHNRLRLPQLTAQQPATLMEQCA
jgi:transposase